MKSLKKLFKRDSKAQEKKVTTPRPINIPEREIVNFMTCVGGGQVELLEQLLDERPSLVHARMKPMMTTGLHEAVRTDHLECVEILLCRRAVCDIGDVLNTNPLHLAAHLGRDAILQRLIREAVDGGIGMDPRDRAYRSPLHLACIAGHVVCCALLVDAGADVNLADDRGMTPLHVAALSEHRQVVHHLLSQAVDTQLRAWQDPDGQDSRYKTPLCYAMYSGHYEQAVTIYMSMVVNNIPIAQCTSSLLQKYAHPNVCFDFVKFDSFIDANKAAFNKVRGCEHEHRCSGDQCPTPSLDTLLEETVLIKDDEMLRRFLRACFHSRYDLNAVGIINIIFIDIDEESAGPFRSRSWVRDADAITLARSTRVILASGILQKLTKYYGTKMKVELQLTKITTSKSSTMQLCSDRINLLVDANIVSCVNYAQTIEGDNSRCFLSLKALTRSCIHVHANRSTEEVITKLGLPRALGNYLKFK